MVRQRSDSRCPSHALGQCAHHDDPRVPPPARSAAPLGNRTHTPLRERISGLPSWGAIQSGPRPPRFLAAAPVSLTPSRRDLLLAGGKENAWDRDAIVGSTLGPRQPITPARSALVRDRSTALGVPAVLPGLSGLSRDVRQRARSAQVARLAGMSAEDLPVAEFAFPGPLRDRLVAAIVAGAKTTT